MIDVSATPETYEYLQRIRQQWNRISPNPLELPEAGQFKDPNATDASKEDDGSSEDPAAKKMDEPTPEPKNKIVGDDLAQVSESRLSANHLDRVATEGNGSELQSEDRDGGGADFSFKGKLSLRIDEIGNTPLVSGEGEPLLELVEDMIRQLDQAARPKGEIQIIRLPGGISGDTLHNALAPMGAQPASSPRPSAPSVEKLGPEGE